AMLFTPSVLNSRCCRSSRRQSNHPRTVLDLIAGMKGLVVRLAGLPHLPEDFQPALAEASQGGGVGQALGLFLLVICLGPSAHRAALVGPEMHGVAEILVAGTAEAGEAFLAGFFEHRRRAGIAAQGVGRNELLAIGAQFSQQSRGELLPGAGEK